MFFPSYFIKEIEKCFPRVLIRYRTTRGSLGELQIHVETLALWTRVPTSISRSPKHPAVFLSLYGNMENVFYLLNRNTAFNQSNSRFQNVILLIYIAFCTFRIGTTQVGVELQGLETSMYEYIDIANTKFCNIYIYLYVD